MNTCPNCSRPSSKEGTACVACTRLFLRGYGHAGGDPLRMYETRQGNDTDAIAELTARRDLAVAEGPEGG